MSRLEGIVTSHCTVFLLWLLELASADEVRRSDEVQHVKCKVCELAVKAGRIYLENHGLLGDLEKGPDALEAICNAKKQQGSWLTQLDFQQEGNSIKVIQHPAFGSCGQECLMAQRACQQALDGNEEQLWQEVSGASDVSELQFTICKKTCGKAPRPLEGGRRDEIFRPLKEGSAATCTLETCSAEATMRSSPQGTEKSTMRSSPEGTDNEQTNEDELGIDLDEWFPYDDSGSFSEDEELPPEDDNEEPPTETDEEGGEGDGFLEEDLSAADELDEVMKEQYMEEVDYIKCQVCGHAVMEGRNFLEERGFLGNVQKATEVVKSICSVKRPEGKWLTRLDLQQEGTAINVVRQEGFGLCKRECLAAQLACQESLQGLEEELLREMVEAREASDLQFSTCLHSCKNSPKPLTSKRLDEAFRIAGNEGRSADQPSKVDAPEEIENVKCQVCELAVREGRAYLEEHELLSDSAKAAQAVEALCVPERPEGKWLTRLDLQQEGGAINVVRHENFGVCKKECSTVKSACEEALKNSERALLKELMMVAKINDLSFSTCNHVCEVAPKLLEGQRKDEIFRLADEAEVNHVENGKGGIHGVANSTESGERLDLMQLGGFRLQIVNDDDTGVLGMRNQFLMICGVITRVLDGCGLIYIVKHSEYVLKRASFALVVLVWIAVARFFGSRQGTQFFFYVFAWGALQMERQLHSRRQRRSEQEEKVAGATEAKKLAAKLHEETTRAKSLEEKFELAKREVFAMKGALQSQKASQSQMEDRWLQERDRRLQIEKKQQEVESQLRLMVAVERSQAFQDGPASTIDVADEPSPPRQGKGPSPRPGLAKDGADVPGRKENSPSSKKKQNQERTRHCCKVKVRHLGKGCQSNTKKN